MNNGRGLRILYVAYPLLPVTRASCGGAEQMLWTLEAEMARRGHETVVAACAGSQVSGKLFSTGAPVRQLDRFEPRDAEHAERILRMLRRVQPTTARFDLIHDKSGSFWRHAHAIDAPVLATLHLPRSFYAGAHSDHDFQGTPANLYFNLVSDSQRRDFPVLPGTLGVVRNGIGLQDFSRPPARRADHLLWIGRICEEKGTQVAIEVARRAGRHLVIAGDVYPFSYHRAYFEREIRPHIDGRRVIYRRRPSMPEKVELLRRAQALLLPSLVNETSSLVAMEAMACGTPVVAFRRGAIPEVVRDGVTGFVVNTAAEMAEALRRLDEIDPLACRRHVQANYSASRMAAEYEALYDRLAPGRAKPPCSSIAA